MKSLHSALVAARLSGPKGKGQSGKSFSGLKPVKVKLWGTATTFSSTSGAALAITNNQFFNGTDFPEIGDFAVIYDEARLLSVRLHYSMSTGSTTPTSITPSVGAVGISFDAASSAPTSVDGVLQLSYNSGPHALYPCEAGAPSLMNARMHIVKAKPGVSLAPITSDDCPGSAWFAVEGLASTAPIMFAVNMFITTNTASVANCTFVCEMDVEFRLRT